jgi:hypothetical protein
MFVLYSIYAAYMTKKDIKRISGAVEHDDDVWMMDKLLSTFTDSNLEFGMLVQGMSDSLEKEFSFSKIKVSGKYKEREKNNVDVSRLLLILSFHVSCDVEDSEGHVSARLSLFWDYIKKEEDWQGAIQQFAAILFGMDAGAAQYGDTAKVIQNQQHFLNQYLNKSKKGVLKKEVVRAFQFMSIQVFSAITLWALKCQLEKEKPEMKKIMDMPECVVVLRGFCLECWNKGQSDVAMIACQENLEVLGYSTHLREIIRSCNKSVLAMVEPKIVVQQDEVGNTAHLLKEPVTGQKMNECFERMEKHLSDIAKGSNFRQMEKHLVELVEGNQRTEQHVLEFIKASKKRRRSSSDSSNPDEERKK